jgi:hypothetical protein
MAPALTGIAQNSLNLEKLIVALWRLAPELPLPPIAMLEPVKVAQYPQFHLDLFGLQQRRRKSEPAQSQQSVLDGSS